MSDSLDDLDALFDEISSQRPSAEDELEALFDEIAAQNPSAALKTEVICEAADLELPPAAATACPTPSHPGAADSHHRDPHNDAPHDADNAQSDKPMFERLGGIVRMLHDSLRELGYDRSLSDVASQIGDAQGRLEYVATLTEQAANKVLNAIDASMPEQDALSKKAKEMESRWEQLYAGQLSVEEFKVLAADSRQFASLAVQTTETEKARLLEIMMAQDFQDITGQLIKKIVHITHGAERELAQLLRDNAPHELKNAAPEESKEKPVELMQGPNVTGTALVQDDVDDLLDSLGF